MPLEELLPGSFSFALRRWLDSVSRQDLSDRASTDVVHSEFRVAGDLKDEPPIPPLVKELILWQAPDSQPTKDERA